MRKPRSHISKNSDLIKSFIRIQGIQMNYEVWAPYIHRGVTGFVDLVIEGGSRISLFKFTRKPKKMEKIVKKLKLERLVYPESRSLESKDVKAYLVIADSRENRKTVLSQYSLLAKQPFEILFLNQEGDHIESISELSDIIPRLFQTRDMHLDKEALRNLISRPNHSQIERAILDFDDPPDVVTGELVKKVDRYMRRSDKTPEDIASNESPSGLQEAESFETLSEKKVYESGGKA